MAGKGGFLASNRNIRILTILHANFISSLYLERFVIPKDMGL